MEGSIPPNRSGVVPTRNPDFAGRRRYVRSEILLVNLTNGPSYPNVGFYRVRTPSSRLHVIAFITYEPDGAEDTAIANWTSSLDAWTRNVHGKPMRANAIFQNQTLPTSWEAVTGVFEWRGNIVVPPGGTAVIPGKLWLTAYWEPAPGESGMPQEELEALFSSCDIEVRSINTFQTVGG